VKSDAFASVETSDVAGGHYPSGQLFFRHYPRRLACPYLKVRASQTNLILTKKQLAE